MELSELAQIRLIALAVGLAILAAWALARAGERRRGRRFAALAASVGRQPVRESEHRWSFTLEVDGRTVEVRHQHLSAGAGAERGAGWQLLTVVPLRGVSQLHSARIRRRFGRRRAAVDDARPGDGFAVQDFGMPLRPGWLGPRVAGALAGFYALELPLAPLDVEEGRLVHRAGERLLRIEGAALRQLLERQAAVAAALERAL